MTGSGSVEVEGRQAKIRKNLGQIWPRCSLRVWRQGLRWWGIYEVRGVLEGFTLCKTELYRMKRPP